MISAADKNLRFGFAAGREKMRLMIFEHKKVKLDLKRNGKTKKRLKIWPIDRKDL